MSWLVILRPTREEMPFEPTDEESQIVSEHYEYLVRLRDQGKLVVAGPSIVAGDTRSGSASWTSPGRTRRVRSSPPIPRSDAGR